MQVYRHNLFNVLRVEIVGFCFRVPYYRSYCKEEIAMTVRLVKEKLDRMQDCIAQAMQYPEETFQQKQASQVSSAKKTYDFKTNKAWYQRKAVDATASELKKALWLLAGNPSKNELVIVDLLNRFRELEAKKEDLSSAQSIVQQMKQDAAQLHDLVPIHSGMNIKAPVVPEDIREEIVLDMIELERCFNAGCFRSAGGVWGGSIFDRS